jgi:general secretion pathway protein A
MAGKPFEYEAPMSTHAPLMAEPSAVEEVKIEKAVDQTVAGQVEVEPEKMPVAERTKPFVTAVAAEPVAIPNADIEALAARITSLEQRVSEQDAALRRVLAMMIDWMDKEANIEARFMQNSRAA